MDHASSSITSMICHRNSINLYDFSLMTHLPTKSSIRSHEDADLLQEDLATLAEWEEQWRMKFHPSRRTKMTVASKRDHIVTYYDVPSSSSSSQWSGFLIECTVDQRRGKETTSSLLGKNS